MSYQTDKMVVNEENQDEEKPDISQNVEKPDVSQDVKNEKPDVSQKQNVNAVLDANKYIYIYYFIIILYI